MGRTELILIIVAAIIIAVIIGWTLRWFFDRLNTSGPMASEEVVARMREAERAHQIAESNLAQTQIAARNMENQLRAEIEAAMDGLGEARREASALRSEVEDLKSMV